MVAIFTCTGFKMDWTTNLNLRVIPRLITTLLLVIPVLGTSYVKHEDGTLPLPVATYNVTTEVMFPYGTNNGDKELPLDSDSKAVVNVNFLFMGEHYDKVYVSLHGHISFGMVPARPLGLKLPYNHPERKDPPMAAVYFADAEQNKPIDAPDNIPSKVYGRVLMSTTEGHKAMLEELGRQVRVNVVTDLHSFNPTHALIVTWHSLRNGGCVRGLTCPRNTFQAAIVTDGVWTYAIYNYKQLTWLGGIYDRCDVSTGKGDKCFPAQVGFNAGYGLLFADLPGSNTNDVLSLTRYQGSKVVGRYIYKVSHVIVHRDACSTSRGQQELAVYPEVAGMLGGEELYTAGPCLPDNNTKVMCKYVLFEASQQDWEVEGRVVDTARVACPVPALTPVGEDVFLMVRQAAWTEYLYRKHIKIDAPSRARRRVKLHDYHGSWLQRNPTELSLSWNPEMLNKGWLDYTDENGNVAPPGERVRESKVDILVHGFRETHVTAERPKREWKHLTVLATGHDNTGQFTFKTADHGCMIGSDCDWHLGAIKVQPTGMPDSILARGLYSDLVPLGWYVENDMTQKHGNQWPEVLCRAWKDPVTPEEAMRWQDELLPCPCTAAQAYTDTARFIVGAECDTNSTEPVPCPMSPSATVCYVSTVPTEQGAETRCCYNKEGHLLNSADSNGGSYSGRVHEAGKKPYTEAHSVPVLSHWLVDKLPYVWCCLWSADPSLCLERYEPQRRTPDCSKHNSSAAAFAFGDPHFVTFDGTNYTFNGYAEYWLVRTTGSGSHLQLQARMANSMGELPGDISATVITAVALQEGESSKSAAPKVNFFLRPPLALDRVSVYVNGEYQDFHTVSVRTYVGTGGTVTIRRNSGAAIQSNFTAVTASGVSVTVAEKAGVLQITTSLPQTFIRRTGGLFGFWDGDSKNDLRSRDGTVDVDPSNAKDVHDKFGVGWKVPETESIFHYFGSMTWTDYQNSSFVPSFTPAFPALAANNVTMEMVDQTCGQNEFCRFDYMTTLSVGIAKSSLEAEAWALQTKDMTAEVPVCPYLYIERSLRAPDATYLVGGKVELTGCLQDYTLIGPNTYHCIKDGEGAKWSPTPEQTICKSNSQIAAEKQQLAIAISVPITLIVVAALVVLIVFLLVSRKKKKTQEPVKGKLDTLPYQEFPVNPAPNPVYGSGVNLSQSRISLASRGSNNSIILTENLVAQRPPRPPKTKPPTDQPDGSANPAPLGHQENQPGDYHVYDNPDFQPPQGHPPYPYRGPQGGLRPMSTVSYYGAESGSRSRDEDSRSLEGEGRMGAHTGPSLQRAHGYDNMAAVGDEAKGVSRPPYPYTGHQEGQQQQVPQPQQQPQELAPDAGYPTGYHPRQPPSTDTFI